MACRPALAHVSAVSDRDVDDVGIAEEGPQAAGYAATAGRNLSEFESAVFDWPCSDGLLRGSGCMWVS
jgi:hypothetical protein